MAPPWRHDRSLEKAAKNRGRPFLGFERGARRLCGRPTCRLTLNLPPLTLCSPALRVSARKSGAGRGEWKVSSMQVEWPFSGQEGLTHDLCIRLEASACQKVAFFMPWDMSQESDATEWEMGSSLSETSHVSWSTNRVFGAFRRS